MPFQHRTPTEKADAIASWDRPDEQFFAAGACHILAGAFLEEHEQSGFSAYLVEPASGFSGRHVFATDETTAFDWRGYRSRRAYLGLLEEECRALMPGWRYSLVPVPEPLGWSFCRVHCHRHPSQFPGDVVARAK